MVTASLLSVLVPCLLFVCYTNGQAIDSCQTPKNKQGTCIVITNCAPLFAILQKRPLALSNADYLRRSQCGFEGTLPKVCCPNEQEPASAALPEPPVPERPVNGGESAGGSGSGNSKPISSNLLPSKSQCGADTQNRIYGGEKAGLDEFPWMALIEYEKANKDRGFYCGGVLISAKYVLTAAHCVVGKDLPKTWKLVSVRLGEYNTESETDCIEYKGNKYKECAPAPQDIAVEERIAHENYDAYDTNQYNDIALLRLVNEATFTDYVKPICLPQTDKELQRVYTGRNVIVAGWGKTETRSESNVKLKLTVPVKPSSQCTNTYRKANVQLSDQTQLCAGGLKGKDSCRGDSGGPLMNLDSDEDGNINWFSIGIVSFGPTPCGMENWPGVYTNVAPYVSWIISKLRP